MEELASHNGKCGRRGGQVRYASRNKSHCIRHVWRGAKDVRRRRQSGQTVLGGRQRLRLIDAEISTGRRFAVYVNHQDSEPRVSEVRPGTRGAVDPVDHRPRVVAYYDLHRGTLFPLLGLQCVPSGERHIRIRGEVADPLPIDRA